MSIFEESDEYCPHCDNHFVRPKRVGLFLSADFLNRS